MPLLALSSGHELGLALVAGGFILFGLISALVVPRWRPQYPGARLGTFLAVVFLLFFGTLAAVEIFGAEKSEAGAKETEQGTTAPTTTGEQPPSPALVGKGTSLYTSLGCVGCHTIDGSKGTGPSFKGLGGSKVALTNGQTVTADASYLAKSIDDPDAEIVKGYPPGLMSVTIKPGSVSPADTEALVALIQSLK